VKLHDTCFLEQLKPHFKEGLPRLRLLLHDDKRIHFDDLATVSEAARGSNRQIRSNALSSNVPRISVVLLIGVDSKHRHYAQ
jgi:hypothetical protein